jgi:hypothetical protein
MKRTRKIEVRVNDQEHERLLELAQAARKTVSAYVRDTALAVVARINTADVVPELEARTHANGTAVAEQKLASGCQDSADADAAQDGGGDGPQRSDFESVVDYALALKAWRAR